MHIHAWTGDPNKATPIEFRNTLFRVFTLNLSTFFTFLLHHVESAVSSGWLLSIFLTQTCHHHLGNGFLWVLLVSFAYLSILELFLFHRFHSPFRFVFSSLFIRKPGGTFAFWIVFLLLINSALSLLCEGMFLPLSFNVCLLFVFTYHNAHHNICLLFVVTTHTHTDDCISLLISD